MSYDTISYALSRARVRLTWAPFSGIIQLEEDRAGDPRRCFMELFPVFLVGIGLIFGGAVILTAYIVYKTMQLP